MVVQGLLLAGQLVAAAGSAYGGYRGGQVTKQRYRRYRQQTFEQYAKLRQLLEAEYNKVFSVESAYLPAVLRGYDQALNETAGFGRDTRNRLEKESAAQQSAVAQYYTSRGLSGSTAVQAGLNATAGSRNDAILSLDDRIRQIKSQLQIGRAQAHGQGIARRVQLQQGHAQDTLNLESSYTNFLMQLMGGGPTGPAGAIGAGLGQAAGTLGQMALWNSILGAGQQQQQGSLYSDYYSQYLNDPHYTAGTGTEFGPYGPTYQSP